MLRYISGVPQVKWGGQFPQVKAKYFKKETIIRGFMVYYVVNVTFIIHIMTNHPYKSFAHH